MKLYICFSTGGNNHHPCAKAYAALFDAGYEPELVKVYGQGFMPGFLQTKGRKLLKKMTGKYYTPVLELDDGTVVYESNRIAEWAKAHPAQ
jgi:glutathione S-transferase